jgi:hypothetical protein
MKILKGAKNKMNPEYEDKGLSTKIESETRRYYLDCVKKMEDNFDTLLEFLTDHDIKNVNLIEVTKTYNRAITFANRAENVCERLNECIPEKIFQCVRNADRVYNTLNEKLGDKDKGNEDKK